MIRQFNCLSSLARGETAILEFFCSRCYGLLLGGKYRRVRPSREQSYTEFIQFIHLGHLLQLFEEKNSFKVDFQQRLIFMMLKHYILYNFKVTWATYIRSACKNVYHLPRSFFKKSHQLFYKGFIKIHNIFRMIYTYKRIIIKPL